MTPKPSTADAAAMEAARAICLKLDMNVGEHTAVGCFMLADMANLITLREAAAFKEGCRYGRTQVGHPPEPKPVLGAAIRSTSPREGEEG